MVNDPAVGAGDRLQVETGRQLLRRVPKPFTPAEFDRCHRDMDGVDEIGVEELSHRVYSTAEPHILAVGRVASSRHVP